MVVKRPGERVATNPFLRNVGIEKGERGRYIFKLYIFFHHGVSYFFMEGNSLFIYETIYIFIFIFLVYIFLLFIF